MGKRLCDEDIPIEYKQAQLKYTNINRLVIQEQEEMQRHDCRGERISAWASYSEKMSTQNERNGYKKKKKDVGGCERERGVHVLAYVSIVSSACKCIPS